MKENTRKLVLSGVFLTLCLILPFLTGQIPAVGKAVSPMHIPVFLCGFICGWPYAVLVGFIAPLLRSFIFHAPVFYPMAVAMSFELAAYGFISGFVYSLFRKNIAGIYIALISAMLGGRAVYGIVRFLLAAIDHNEYTFKMFLTGAFVQAVPGIIIHLILVPAVVWAVCKRERMNRYGKK